MQTSTITTPHTVAERRFYTGMAIVIFMSVLVGFSRSFFLKPLFPDYPAPTETLFYFHGAAFTMWILLFVMQVTLVSRGGLKAHRKLGVLGGVLAAAMVVLGIWGALTAAAREGGFIGMPVPGLQFLAVPLFDMILFPLFIILAFIERHNAQSHKRWMLLATLNLITAAIARWPVVGTMGPLVFFGITDLFVVALAVWDFRTRKKLHPVTLWGGLIFIISQPLRLIVSGTAAWIAFATWATGFVKG